MSGKALKLHDWELILDSTKTDSVDVWRLRVPSGWLYRVDSGDAVFVPEPGLYQQER